MEGAAVEREYSALGNLFQQIITDMKNGTPIWEDFIAKASKLHAVLRSALTAVSAYLDAFQKIADAATSARGATKEIGTALTRMCLRHKAMESRMKAFTCAIMDCLVNPLQEKLEDWKKTLINIDKDHSREYKRARAELKKRSTDTLRLQKKARKGKGGDLQRRVETCMQDVNERRQILEDAEKKAVRAALVEERSRFCVFVALLKPVVDSEVAMLAEMSHLQEGAGQLLRQTTEPYSLPAASEQVISDLQALGGSHWTPPSSPPSPRSRASASLCSSMSSLNSSSSGSHSGSHSGSVHHQLPTPLQGQTPGLAHTQRSASQPPRLGSVSSRDSGFTSQDTLHQLTTLIEFRKKGSDSNSGSSCATPVGAPGPLLTEAAPPAESSTWPDLKDTMQFERAANAIMGDRPHTISTAYEKGHSRPALSVHTFSGHAGSETALGASASQPASPCYGPPGRGSQASLLNRPPLPTRCSSLERPAVPSKGPAGHMLTLPEHKVIKPSSIPSHLTKDTPQATYVNMFELASMAASRAQGLQQAAASHSTEHAQANTHEKACESSTSESSLESSSGYGSQGACQIEDAGQHQYSMEEPTTADSVIMDITISSKSSETNGFPQEFSLTGTGFHQELGALSASLCCLEENVRSLEEMSATPATFATINKTKPCVPKRRPLSMTATCPPAGLRLGLSGRRGSAGGANNKPPPPVRRSSSISRPQQPPQAHQQPSENEYGNTTVGRQPDGDDNLPPPPAFLLNPHDQHQQQLQHQHQQSAENQNNATPPHGKGINVAETVKALTELKHTPASPSLIRRQNMLQQQQQQQNSTPSTNNGSQQPMSSFQQSKSTFTALQNNSNVNPIYGQTGHKMFTYVEQTSSSLYGSRNSSFTNLSSNSAIYGREFNNSINNIDNCDGMRMNTSTSYNATVTYSSSPNTSNYSDNNSMSSFGMQRSQNLSIYGQSTFGKQHASPNPYEKRAPFSPVSSSSGNTIYAQPSQIIAGFNNLGFGGNRNHEGNMSPMAMRKSMATPRSQSADRRGSDFSSSSGGLIAAISARLAPQLSPRNARRSISHETDVAAPFRTSQDSLASYHAQGNHQKNAPNVVQPAFLDKLSATLRQRQATGSPNKACTVRQIINTKAQPDPRVCHGSLMEQIKRGATLKRNKHCNDRSAPKIH